MVYPGWVGCGLCSKRWLFMLKTVTFMLKTHSNAVASAHRRSPPVSFPGTHNPGITRNVKNVKNLPHPGITRNVKNVPGLSSSLPTIGDLRRKTLRLSDLSCYCPEVRRLSGASSLLSVTVAHRGAGRGTPLCATCLPKGYTVGNAPCSIQSSHLSPGRE